ncbi:MAG: riboflavin synthase subunit alpha [Thermodesulfovibrio sp. RBG_19FT_COMBO_41_18]|nr:MAG: riboflavin synthase subunit alpha [Thermodesulfovibrio sp. RBG_19FT_COMBO_41_18]
MFTGLILEIGEISSFKKRSGGAILSLKANEVASTAKKGDSISVNGVCLTIVSKNNNTLSFDLSEETLRCTNLGSLKTGDIVNLEPSLSPDSKIGGHFVTGHVDAAGRIRSKVNIGDMMKVEIKAPANIINFLVEKGSVAVDGISLTIVDILKDGFTVVIIPHTAKLTTMGFKVPGDTVNIEVDILGKYVARFLNRDKNRDSRFMNTLMEEGYTK